MNHSLNLSTNKVETLLTKILPYLRNNRWLQNMFRICLTLMQNFERFDRDYKRFEKMRLFLALAKIFSPIRKEH